MHSFALTDCIWTHSNQHPDKPALPSNLNIIKRLRPKQGLRKCVQGVGWHGQWAPNFIAQGLHLQQELFLLLLLLLLLWWRYSLGWALASFAIRPQASQSLALSLHSFIPIFLRSVDTSSNRLIFGRPLRLVAYSFPYIFFGNCGVLHSFFVTNPSYSLAFNEPDNVLPLNYNF